MKEFRQHEAGLPLFAVGHLDRTWGSRARDPGSFSRGARRAGSVVEVSCVVRGTDWTIETL